MNTFLVLKFESTMSSFGGESIDQIGVVRDFPARSMLCGLVANALGLDRSQGVELDRLQDRIEHASALVRAGHRLREYQTARLFENDAGWTTRGAPEGRAKSPSFKPDTGYEAVFGIARKSLTHQRMRDYDADACTIVALGLRAKDGEISLDDVAKAMDRPERPLFIGRKPNIPSGRLLQGRLMADSALHALVQAIPAGDQPVRVQWSPESTDENRVQALESVSIPGADGFKWSLQPARRHRIADMRRHRTGVHGGDRAVLDGVLTSLSTPQEATVQTEGVRP